MSSLELRIALVAVAIVVIAVMYIWYRTNAKDQPSTEVDAEEFDLVEDLKNIPSFDEADDQGLLTEDLRSEFQDVSQELREETISKRRQAVKKTSASVPEKTSTPTVTSDKTLAEEISLAASKETSPDETLNKEMLIVVNVAARSPSKFTGPMIARMMEELDLEHGEMGVYHYYVERLGKKTSMYCVASMLKPGTFDLDAMQSFGTPGLSLILQLPGPEDGLKAYNIMLDHAQRIATYLNGDLLDQNRNQLTQQAISATKEHVQLFSLRADRDVAHG